MSHDFRDKNSIIPEFVPATNSWQGAGETLGSRLPCLRPSLLKSLLASVPSSLVIGPKKMAAAKQAGKWLTCVQASMVRTSRPWAANGNRKFFFSFDAFWHHRICNGKSPDIKTRVFQSKASSRNSATKETVNFRLTLSVIKLCQGSCAFISMLSSMEVVSKLQRTRRD